MVWAKEPPTHGRGLHKEATGNSTDRETNELSRHDDHPLVCSTLDGKLCKQRSGLTREVVVLVVVHPLDGNDIRSVGAICTNGGHDS